MKKSNYTLKIGFAIALTMAAFSSCKPSFDEFDAKSGDKVDFSSYIAIGNSLTAGFADGGLYLDGQKVAFPNLIAEQLQSAGGGSFTSPFFAEANRNGSTYLQLASLVNGQPTMKTITEFDGFRSDGRLVKNTEPIQNYGVPGMRLDLAFFAPFSNLNMYFERLLEDSKVGTTTYFDFTTKADHTFFTFWLGNNDVLGYATNGAVDLGNGTTGLTDTTTFKGLYRNYIATLTAAQQKGVVATIPEITTVPYFTTVTRAALLAAVNASSPVQVTNIFISAQGASRPATDADLFLLPFSSSGELGVPNSEGLPYGLHPDNPVESKWVLDPVEVKQIAATVASYNRTIKAVAKEFDLAVADAHAYLNKVKGGIIYNGLSISSAFIQGNAFSLDGIHLTPIGNALVANLFIDAINKTYGSTVPRVEVTKYQGVKYP